MHVLQGQNDSVQATQQNTTAKDVDSRGDFKHFGLN